MPLKNLKNQKWFLAAVYTTMIIQLLLTFGIVYSFRQHPLLSNATKQSFILYFIMLIGLLLLMILVPMPLWLQFLLFTIFAIVQGAALHSVTSMLPRELIDQTIISVIGIFITFTVFGIILASFDIDLSWMGMMLFAAIIGLLIGYITMIFVNDKKGFSKYLAVFGLIIFSMYVMFETNVILNKKYNGNFIMAALDFYIDFMNLFSNLLLLNSS